MDENNNPINVTDDDEEEELFDPEEFEEEQLRETHAEMAAEREWQSELNELGYESSNSNGGSESYDADRGDGMYEFDYDYNSDDGSIANAHDSYQFLDQIDAYYDPTTLFPSTDNNSLGSAGQDEPMVSDYDDDEKPFFPKRPFSGYGYGENDEEDSEDALPPKKKKLC